MASTFRRSCCSLLNKQLQWIDILLIWLWFPHINRTAFYSDGKNLDRAKVWAVKNNFRESKSQTKRQLLKKKKSDGSLDSG